MCRAPAVAKRGARKIVAKRPIKKKPAGKKSSRLSEESSEGENSDADYSSDDDRERYAASSTSRRKAAQCIRQVLASSACTLMFVSATICSLHFKLTACLPLIVSTKVN